MSKDSEKKILKGMLWILFFVIIGYLWHGVENIIAFLAVVMLFLYMLYLYFKKD